MKEPKLHAKGAQYYAVFSNPDRYPTRKWIKLDTTREKVAQKRMYEMEQGVHFGSFDPWEDKARFNAVSPKEAVQMYLLSKASRRRASTQADDQRLLSQFTTWLKPGKKLGHVTSGDVSVFINEPKRPSGAPSKTGIPARKTAERTEPRSDATKHTYHARLNAFFVWAEQEKLVVRNPMGKLEKPSKGEAKPLYLTRADYTAVLAAIEKDAEEKRNGLVRGASLRDGQIVWLSDIVQVAVGTGLRSGEIRNLRWSAINLDDTHLTVRNVRAFKTKSGHERNVPLDGDALATLRRLDGSRPDRSDDYVFKPTSTLEGTNDVLNGGFLNKRFKKYAKAAGLEGGVTFHTLRHTYASWLVISGASLYVVKDLMGHASIGTTEKYAHLAPKVFKSAVQAAFGTDAGRHSDNG